MSLENTLLSLPELQKLHHAGYDPIILHSIENDLIMQASEMHMMKGNNFATREDLLQLAAQLLPRGDNILVLYKETAQSRASTDPENLAMLAEHIERVAYDLENIGAKFLAARNTNVLSPEKFEKAQAVIGIRYADLIDASKKVEEQGGPASFLNFNLLSADERPEGPLAAFYDAAIATLASRPSTETYQRLRATG